MFHGPAASTGSLLEMQNLEPSPKSLLLIGLPGASCTVKFVVVWWPPSGEDTAVVYQQGPCISFSTSGLTPSSWCTTPACPPLPRTHLPSVRGSALLSSGARSFLIVQPLFSLRTRPSSFWICLCYAKLFVLGEWSCFYFLTLFMLIWVFI